MKLIHNKYDLYMCFYLKRAYQTKPNQTCTASFVKFLKFDRQEKLSIEPHFPDESVSNAFDASIRSLQNLKTLDLQTEVVLIGLLNENIESLRLSWNVPSRYKPPVEHEVVENFIRGPSVKNLILRYSILDDRRQLLDSGDVYATFLSTVNLKQYFPKLERVDCDFLKENEDFKLVKCPEPVFINLIF